MRAAEGLLREHFDGRGDHSKELSKIYGDTITSFNGFCENMRLCNLLEVVSIPVDATNGHLVYSNIRDFYNKFPIQSPDKELLSATTFYGSGNGILTADKGIMKAYRKGAKKFSLDGFICDSTRSEIEWVGGRKIYSCG